MTRNISGKAMAPRFLAAACLLGALTLAGCHRSAKSDDQRTAAGQVMSGSITDAMLPYDTLRSQPQLAPARAATDAPSAVAADSGADGVTGGEAPAPGLESEVKGLPGR